MVPRKFDVPAYGEPRYAIVRKRDLLDDPSSIKPWTMKEVCDGAPVVVVEVGLFGRSELLIPVTSISLDD